MSEDESSVESVELLGVDLSHSAASSPHGHVNVFRNSAPTTLVSTTVDRGVPHHLVGQQDEGGDSVRSAATSNASSRRTDGIRADQWSESAQPGGPFTAEEPPPHARHVPPLPSRLVSTSPVGSTGSGDPPVMGRAGADADDKPAVAMSLDGRPILRRPVKLQPLQTSQAASLIQSEANKSTCNSHAKERHTDMPGDPLTDQNDSAPLSAMSPVSTKSDGNSTDKRRSDDVKATPSAEVPSNVNGQGRSSPVMDHGCSSGEQPGERPNNAETCNSRVLVHNGPTTDLSIALPIPPDAEEQAALFSPSNQILSGGTPSGAEGRRNTLDGSDAGASPNPSRQIDEENDGRVHVPYQIDTETFPVPLTCPDDHFLGADRYWSPGKPLRIAYVTWNLASNSPRMGEVASSCVHPNAHLVIVGTQENGPYIGTNSKQNRWTHDLASKCLSDQYTIVGKCHMWAVHIVVFARTRDVAQYISHVDASRVTTGLMCGMGGNKGGVAVALAVSMKPLRINDPESHRSVHGSYATSRADWHRNHSEDPTDTRGHIDSPVTPATVNVTATARGSTFTVATSNNGLDDMKRQGSSTDKSFLDNDGHGPALQSHRPSAPLSPDTNGRAGASDGGCPLDSTPHNPASATPKSQSQAALPPPFDCGSRLHRSDHAEEDSDDSSEDSVEMEILRLNSSETQVGHPRPPSGRASGLWHGRRKERGYRGSETAPSTPEYMTILCITSHLAAHQGAVHHRNRDYRKIVRRLKVGYRGKHRQFFKKQFKKKRRTYGEGTEYSQEVGSERRDRRSSSPRLTWQRRHSHHPRGSGYGSNLDAPPDGDEVDSDDETNIATLQLPNWASESPGNYGNHRDVTEEYDITFFGGDLNYRIDGTRQAIEYIIRHHKDIRSILINNDQLTLERTKGTVFQGFQEGALFFRPTYKYEVSSEAGVTSDEYNYAQKRNRMPAYCDRVLYKRRRGSAVKKVAIRLYTDVPNVRTSDHRPVVAIFDVATRACYGEP